MWRRPDNGRNTIDAYTTKERNAAFPLTVILQVGQVKKTV